MTRVHPRDQAAFSAFLDRDWSDGSSPVTVNYRLNCPRGSSWVEVRHTGKSYDDNGVGTVSGLVEVVSRSEGSRTLLDSLERQFVEDRVQFDRFVASAVTLAAENDPLPILEQVRVRFGAGIVTLVRIDRCFEVTEAFSSVCESARGKPAIPATPLAAALSGLASGDDQMPISFELAGDDHEFAHYLVRPVGTVERSLAGALCVGFRNSADRDNAARQTGLLSLAAAVNACRWNREVEETHRREMLDQLWQAQRFSGLGRLSGGFAHDLKNLVTVVQGHLHLLEQRLDCGDLRGGRESLRQIRHASEEAAESAERLLLFGGSAGTELRPCNLNELVDRFTAMMRRVLEENIEIRLDLEPGVPSVLADETGLREVLMNLLVNARDAMREGGVVTIETRSAQLDGNGAPRPGASLRVRARVSGRSCEFANRPLEHRESDHGFGTHLVAKIVADHSGQIESCDQPGASHCIGILLPAAGEGFVAATRPAERPRGLGRRSLGDTNLKGTTILLVEDEPAVRKLVRKLLEALGCEVVEAASGRKALDLWPTIRHRVSLVVSDIVMPEGVSGWDLAKELHRRHPDLGILLTSGYSELPEDHGLDGVPQIGYLQKPYGAEVLRGQLSRLLTLESLPR